MSVRDISTEYKEAFEYFRHYAELLAQSRYPDEDRHYDRLKFVTGYLFCVEDIAVGMSKVHVIELARRHAVLRA